jgi:hypothetical protein
MKIDLPAGTEITLIAEGSTGPLTVRAVPAPEPQWTAIEDAVVEFGDMDRHGGAYRLNGGNWQHYRKGDTLRIPRFINTTITGA